MADRPDDWIRIGQVARLLGVSDGTVRRIARKGFLRVRKYPGGRPRYSRQSVLDLIARSTNEPTA